MVCGKNLKNLSSLLKVIARRDTEIYTDTTKTLRYAFTPAVIINRSCMPMNGIVNFKKLVAKSKWYLHDPDFGHVSICY